METIEQIKRKQFVCIQSVEEMYKLGEDFISQLHSGTVLGLDGDLGAGKTSFVKGVADALGVKDKVKSPSFEILHIYEIENHPFLQHMIHVDAYRLNKEMHPKAILQTAIDIGLYDFFGKESALIIIEWPEIFYSLMPENSICLSFEHGDKECHRIVGLSDWWD